MHPVGSYCTDISRCTLNKTLNSRNSQAFVKQEAIFRPLSSVRWMQFIAFHPPLLICILILSHYVKKSAFFLDNWPNLYTNLSSILYKLQAPPISRPLDLITKIITGDVQIFGDSMSSFLSYTVLFIYFFILLLSGTLILHAHSTTLVMTQVIILKISLLF